MIIQACSVAYNIGCATQQKRLNSSYPYTGERVALGMPAPEEKGGVVKTQDTLFDRSVSSKVPWHVELESSPLGWNLAGKDLTCMISHGSARTLATLAPRQADDQRLSCSVLVSCQSCQDREYLLEVDMLPCRAT